MEPDDVNLLLGLLGDIRDHVQAIRKELENGEEADADPYEARTKLLRDRLAEGDS